jgi:hypothetical protein
MSEEEALPETASTEATEETRNVYLAFCDILGFSSMLMRDFDATLELYREFSSSVEDSESPENVQVTMYSDSILITGPSLLPVVTAVQLLWFTALTRGFMIRGAISYGKYWERRTGRSLLVASDALVRAVKLESSVGVPAVFIADDVEVDDFIWAIFYTNGPFACPVLHFRDRNIVNPFNSFWFRSAKMRAELMLEEHPAHQDKYLWFLALHSAIESGKELTPEGTLEELLTRGVTKNLELPPTSDA